MPTGVKHLDLSLVEESWRARTHSHRMQAPMEYLLMSKGLKSLSRVYFCSSLSLSRVRFFNVIAWIVCKKVLRFNAAQISYYVGLTPINTNVAFITYNIVGGIIIYTYNSET